MPETKENITPKNCRGICKSRIYNDTVTGHKAAAWSVVHDFCTQNGMRYQTKSGIESVICFIQKKINQAKTNSNARR